MDQVIEAVEDTALKITAERILPKNIITEMSNKLRNLPQLNVEISCNIGDNEGYTLAEQVKSIFNNAEWKISGVFQSAFVPPAKHILLEFGSQPPKELRKALLPLFDRFGYAREAIIKSNLPDNRLNIIVGSK